MTSIFRLLLVFVLAGMPLLAAARTALVIGNGSYTSAPLDNPVNDATDVAARLGALGFEVDVLIDASRRDMRRAIRDYSDRLRQSGGVGLFYYAGHGMQIQGVNYLVPTDALMQNEFEIPDEAVSANSVLRAVEEAGNDLNIVILDACRDNPFARSYRSGSTRGLARMDAPGGSIIAYATAPGNVALDGDGRNGVYTKHLLANLDKPGMPIEQMFKQVRIGVIDESNGQQTPWEESSLRSDFYFTPAQVTEVALPATAAIPPTVSAETLEVRPATPASPETPLPEKGTVAVSAAARDANPAPQWTNTNALLVMAAEAMNDYRLTTPENDSALYYYQQVLSIDPVNLEAHQGLQVITRRYIALAERELREHNPRKARAYITRGLEIQPQNVLLIEMRDEADALERQQEQLASRAEPAQPERAPESIEPIAQTAALSPAIDDPSPAQEVFAHVDDAPVNTMVSAAAEADGLERESSDVTYSDAARAHSARMKKDFDEDVEKFKQSFQGIGNTLRSSFGGLFGNRNSGEN